MGIRVLVAKPGLDGHDKGAKTVALALRDAGMEVIYTGLHRSVEAIVKAAVEEDVDVIGLSILSGAHVRICEKLFARMKEAGIPDKAVIVGGVIPAQDHDRLRALGVRAIFTMGAPFEEIVKTVERTVETKCRTRTK